MRPGILASAALVAAGCSATESGSSLRFPTPRGVSIERQLPITVINDAFEPMPGAHVVSSVGEEIIDHQVTDSHGKAILVVSVADDAVVTVHEVLPDAHLSQTVSVLAEDETLELRFRLSPPIPRTDVSIDLSRLRRAVRIPIRSRHASATPPSCSEHVVAWRERIPAFLLIDRRACMAQRTDPTTH